MFVLYATSSANGVAQKSSRKTITGPDVVTAMGEMEFDKFVRPLENSLASKKCLKQRQIGLFVFFSLEERTAGQEGHGS